MRTCPSSSRAYKGPAVAVAPFAVIVPSLTGAPERYPFHEARNRFVEEGERLAILISDACYVLKRPGLSGQEESGVLPCLLLRLWRLFGNSKAAEVRYRLVDAPIAAHRWF